jgi:hypothetical protein
LTVLEGTNISYKTATLAEPGEIKGEAAKLLSAERKVELKVVMKDFISKWGIALDVEIKVAANILASARNIPAAKRQQHETIITSKMQDRVRGGRRPKAHTQKASSETEFSAEAEGCSAEALRLRRARSTRAYLDAARSSLRPSSGRRRRL